MVGKAPWDPDRVSELGDIWRKVTGIAGKTCSVIWAYKCVLLGLIVLQKVIKLPS